MLLDGSSITSNLCIANLVFASTDAVSSLMLTDPCAERLLLNYAKSFLPGMVRAFAVDVIHV